MQTGWPCSPTIGGNGDRRAIARETAAASVSTVGGCDVRMIDRQEHRGVGFRRNQRQTALQRTEHAALGIGIHGKQNIAAALDAGANLVRVLRRPRQ